MVGNIIFLTVKCKLFKAQRNQPSITINTFIFQKFSELHNMFRPTWPSSGNSAVYGIRRRKLSI